MYLINSNGHSATRWISSRLTKENFSKCYHSTDLIDQDAKLNNLEDYFNHLRDLEEKNHLIYGSIHLPFRIGEKDFEMLNSKNVNIFNLIRNPIFKINSMIQFYLEKFLLNGFFTDKKKVFKDKFNNFKTNLDELFLRCGDEINDLFTKYQKYKHYYFVSYIYETFRVRTKKNFYNMRSFEEYLISQKNIKYISLVLINLFLFASSSCLKFDKQAKKFPFDKLILYEKVTQDKSSFLNYAKKIDKRFNDNSINLINFEKKVGSNFINSSGHKFWPSAFYNHLLKKVEDEKLQKFYQEVKYEI